jgi:hypothetical protein
MRKLVTLGIFFIFCLIALSAADRIALGQAGSTGGTIGKTDKSASGGEDRDEHSGRGHGANKQSGPAGRSLTGRWRWQSSCPLGTGWHGSFEIGRVSGGVLSGTIVNGDRSVGEITGRISDNSITFTNSVGPEYWSGTISNGQMNGSAGPCQWKASR